MAKEEWCGRIRWSDALIICSKISPGFDLWTTSDDRTGQSSSAGMVELTVLSVPGQAASASPLISR
jgi:hypothetical protein